MITLIRSFARTLYDNRSYRFWAYQIGGWTGYSVATFLTITVMDGNASLYHLMHIALQAFLGILTTWPLRSIYRTTFDSPLAVRASLATLSIIAFSAIWTALRIDTFMRISGETGLWQEFHYWYFGSLFVFLSWTVLYYGIHYYELMIIEHQKLLESTALREREISWRLQAESAARQAQLRMLRYQLNPHFLFNTLNAINAQVRLGESRQAGDMIQYLSQFLRHSLEQDSVEDIPLSREIELLKLYLNIEQVRFGDRLRVRFDIDQKAMDALVPVLILQPIVENAMKHAISPSETGGSVDICARVSDSVLEIRILDSGPGVDPVAETEGRGIGLSNTLQRLRTLYGDDYQFTTENRVPSGLAVIIRLPLTIIPEPGAEGLET